MRLREQINISCAGKVWWFRLPITIFLIYLAYQYATKPQYESIFFGLNLGIHEMGHFLFFWTTKFWYVAGGTILQLFVPILAVYMFYKQKDFYAISVAGFWFSTNLYNVATYLGDARSQILPLVSIGGQESKHDWHYLLNELHLITSDKTIAGNIRIFAFIFMWSSIFFGIYLLIKMSKSKKIQF